MEIDNVMSIMHCYQWSEEDGEVACCVGTAGEAN